MILKLLLRILVEFLLRQQSRLLFRSLEKLKEKKCTTNFSAKEKEVETAIVQRTDGKGNIIVNLGKTDAILPMTEQLPGETYKFNDRLKVYILKVSLATKGPQVTVSRTHYELVKRLFELECPEIFDGTV